MTRASSRPTALVTGASRGIGRAIAQELARTHRILVGGRDRAAVAAVVAELPSAVCSGVLWKTPRPRAGMVTWLLRVSSAGMFRRYAVVAGRRRAGRSGYGQGLPPPPRRGYRRLHDPQ